MANPQLPVVIIGFSVFKYVQLSQGSGLADIGGNSQPHIQPTFSPEEELEDEELDELEVEELDVLDIEELDELEIEELEDVELGEDSDIGKELELVNP